MAEKQNPAEPSSGQSTSKEVIQEIAQTVARKLLSELKSTSTQQQDLALPSGKRFIRRSKRRHFAIPLQD